jgi:predicted metal-dependent HD superfamily phosphohydrolase
MPDQPDAQLVTDVDLAVFGKSREGFDAYEAGIRSEFSWVPGVTYRHRRVALLKKFLQRPSIYCTQFFQEQYEDRARRNLELAVRKHQRGI